MREPIVTPLLYVQVRKYHSREQSQVAGLSCIEEETQVVSESKSLNWAGDENGLERD